MFTTSTNFNRPPPPNGPSYGPSFGSFEGRMGPSADAFAHYGHHWRRHGRRGGFVTRLIWFGLGVGAGVWYMKGKQFREAHGGAAVGPWGCGRSKEALPGSANSTPVIASNPMNTAPTQFNAWAGPHQDAATTVVEAELANIQRSRSVPQERKIQSVMDEKERLDRITASLDRLSSEVEAAKKKNKLV